MIVSRIGKFRRWAGAVAMATLVGMGSGAANAAVYTTNWDPLFNPQFFTEIGVNLGWSGSATIFVDNACVAASTTVSFPNGCGAASLTGYNYTLYDTIPSSILFSGGDAGNLSPDPDQVRFDSLGVANGMTLGYPGFIVPMGSPFMIGGYSFDAELSFVIDGGVNEAYTGPVLSLRGGPDST